MKTRELILYIEVAVFYPEIHTKHICISPWTGHRVF